MTNEYVLQSLIISLPIIADREKQVSQLSTNLTNCNNKTQALWSTFSGDMHGYLGDL